MFQTFPGEGDPATWFVGRGRQKQPFLSNVSSLVVVPGTVPSGGQPAEKPARGFTDKRNRLYYTPPQMSIFFPQNFAGFLPGGAEGKPVGFLDGEQWK